MAELLELPDYPEETPAFPNTVATEQGFYSAAIKGDNTIEDATNTSRELEMDGFSNLHNQAQELHMEDQDGLDRRVVSDIIADPSIPTDIRTTVMRNFLDTQPLDHDIRNLYMKRTATIIPKDNDRTSEDLQAIVMDTISARDKEASEVQDLVNSLIGGLSGEATGVVAGMTRDWLPVTSLTINAQAGGLLATLGFSPVEIAKGTLLIGSASKAIAEKYKAAPLETKKAFVKEVFETLSQFPGTDYNLFEKMRDMIIDDDMPEWEITLENIGNALNFVPLYSLIKSPVKFLREMFTLTKRTKLSQVDFPSAPDFRPPGTSVVVRDPTIEGEIIPAPRKLGGDKGVDISDAEIIAEGVRPRTAPRGPLGTTNTANPSKAAEMAETILDEAARTGASTTARAMGTSPGEVLADFVLPKIADLGTFFPSLDKMLINLDKRFSDLFDETRFNPAVGAVTERKQQLEEVSQILQSNRTATYQQSNSTVFQGLFESTGTGVFGRNSNYGYLTKQDAEDIIGSVQTPDGATLRTFEKDGQWYIAADWKRTHDPLSDRVFGTDSISTKFLGLDVSGLSRTVFGAWIWPSTMRVPPWVAKGAATTHMAVARIEREFADAAARSITPLRNNKAFNNLLNETQEQGKYFTTRELVDKHPNLTKGELAEIVEGYTVFRRLAEYEYNWANRYDRKMKEAAGHEAIYVNDKLVGFGTRTFPEDVLTKAKYVYDFQTGTTVPKTKNMRGTFVALEDAIWNGNRLTTIGYIQGATKIGGLPYQTLNRIEGYIPRRNKERWYITSRFNEVFVNGNRTTDTAEFSRVIAAATDKRMARRMVADFQAQRPDQIIDIKIDRANTADSMLIDHRLHKEQMLRSSTRGERLNIINNVPARLDDPFRTLMDSIKATARLNMWSDYDQVFHRNFIRAFNEFLPKHAYPNSITDIQITKNASPEVTAKFEAALRLFENRRQQDYVHGMSDEVFKKFMMRPAADFAEFVRFNGMADWLDSVGAQGLVPVRAMKALNSVLYLHLNPFRQLLVQPQQLLEFAAVSPTIIPKMFRQGPAIMMGINAQASMSAPYRKAMMAIGKQMSGLSKGEYEAVVDAVVKSGLPESVDLNMMFHGLFQDVSRSMHESVGRQFVEGAKNVVKFPGRAGKAVGYGPAELVNQIGGFIFARERWIKNNPGKNWNTPEHVQQIVGDGWDITHNMATRAGAMPYQDGIFALFMQFVAVSHKAFMQAFSSKTLTGPERAKIAVVRAALFGVKGIPVGFGIHWLVHQLNDPEVHAIFNEMEGGLTDFGVNALIDVFMSDPDAIDEQESNLSIAASLSPLPETMPVLDFLIQGAKLFDGQAGTDPRFPFTSTLGAMGKAITNIKSNFAVNEYDTEESLLMVATELAKSASGFNNLTKYMMLKEWRDKADSLGRTFGLDVAEKNMTAQLFGIITKDEQYLHDMNALRFDDANYVKARAKEITDQLTRFSNEGQLGTEPFFEWQRRLRILNSFTRDGLMDQVEDMVYDTFRVQQDTKMQNALTNILRHHQDENTRAMTEQIARVQTLADRGNKDAIEFIRRLEFLKRLRGDNTTE